MDFFKVMSGLGDAAVIGTNVLKWINDNLLSRLGGLSGIIVKIVDFFKNLFKDGGTGTKVLDFFKNLFG